MTSLLQNFLIGYVNIPQVTLIQTRGLTSDEQKPSNIDSLGHISKTQTLHYDTKFYMHVSNRYTSIEDKSHQIL